MYTVLVVTSNNACSSFYTVVFATIEAAQNYRPVGVECEVDVVIYPGELSADEAIAEYLD